MKVSVSRRQVVSGLGAVSLAALLSACGEDQPKTGEAPPAPKPETPAVKVPPPQGKIDVARLMEAGALPDKVLGKDDAPVTIVEYASMTCGHCGAFHRNTLPALKEKYIDTGKARLILREFPFDPRAEAGFMLARCSQDKYFAMADVLFKQQDSWVPAQDGRQALLQIARLAGFSQETFEACLTDQKLLEDVRSVKGRAEKDFGVTSTPTFFINGDKYAGAMSIGEFSAIIDAKL